MPTPYCPHQPECVGCPLSATALADQLADKRQQVQHALQVWDVLHSVTVAEVQGAAQQEQYRLRAKWVHEAGKLGLYGQASHVVVDTPLCRILHPNLKRALDGLRQLLPLAHQLLAVDARLADDGVLLTLVVPPATDVIALRATAQQLLDLACGIRGVAYALRESDSPQVLGGTPVPLLGERELRHHLVKDKPYHLAVFGGFVQAHAAQASLLNSRVEELVHGALGKLAQARITEFYGGAGALALRLAAAGAQVTVVDSYAPSVALIERAAQQQKLALRAVTASVENALPCLKGVDAVIVDPPRRGLSFEVRCAIAQAAPAALVYVSCDPLTLARDLAHLAWLGYRTEQVEPVDLMPYAAAVESVVLLRRGAAPALEVLFQDADLVVVNKPAHLPTTPHPEHTQSVLELVRQLPDCAAAVPVHRLDAGTTGVCLFATHPAAAAELSAALASGHKTYLALAQGVVHKRGVIRRALLEGRVPRSAETRYERTRVVGTHSLIAAHPKQGRKHQIRRHFEAIGHALVGDAKYAKSGGVRYFFERYGLDRPFLHCSEIVLNRKQGALTLGVALPQDLKQLLDALGGG